MSSEEVRKSSSATTTIARMIIMSNNYRFICFHSFLTTLGVVGGGVCSKAYTALNHLVAEQPMHGRNLYGSGFFDADLRESPN
jgi:hypothetical protein